MTSVTRYDAARRALADCCRVDEVKTIHDKAVALKVYAKQANDTALRADAERIMWRAKDRMGELLKEMAAKGERQSKGGDKHSSSSKKVLELADLGITKKLSSEAQRVAAMDIKQKEEALASDTPDKAMKQKLKASNGAASESNTAKKPRKAPKRHDRADDVIPLADKGMSNVDIAAATGVGERQVRHIIEEEAIRRAAKAEPDVKRADLSMTAQQKFDAAMRQEKRRLESEFDERVRVAVLKRIDEYWLPKHKQMLAQAKAIIGKHKGFIPRAMFIKILACCESSQRKSLTDAWLNEAFIAFKALERVLVSAKEMPAETPYVPNTWDEFVAHKKAAAKAAKAHP